MDFLFRNYVGRGDGCKMDFPESTRIVLQRIQQLEPENVSKITGYLLLQDLGEREMIRLACGTDSQIQSLINEAKIHLNLSPKPFGSSPIPPSLMSSSPNSDLPHKFTPYSPAASRPFSSHGGFRVAPSPHWDPQLSDQQPIHNMDFIPPPYSESINDDFRLQNYAQFLMDEQMDSVNGGGDFPGSYYYPDGALGVLARNRRPPSLSLPDFPMKACHYFNKGFCKHGTSCRFSHGQNLADSFSQIFSPNGNDLGNEDHMFLPGSLETLEMELTELLKSRRGLPVSIASLPMLYYEKYGRNLQAEGYLTESQRHGKAGYSLTKLLARLKNSIRLIDRCDHHELLRPHGQHSVVLAEDASRYMDYRSERTDPGTIVSGSRQIYLTFPAESTFTEEDVSNYFKSFGPVQDVRIPCQQKRMFGFVTFLYTETAEIILAKGNPHFVCGARVLVKPYREKSRLVDRKYNDKLERPMYFPNFLDMDHELQAIEHSRLLRKQMILEEQEQALEYERRRLAEFQVATKPLAHTPYFGYTNDELRFSEACADHNDFQSANRFGYMLDMLQNGSTSDDNARHSNNNYTDQESQGGLNLPESPFATPIPASGISTAT
ncbi:zinc finger CCCH domain-containing protein 18-like isoform X1 [Papaver somniferum]|uniref:zinc finger CCCH domain-containing protein 18-like isoform X1 n=2 Tax=Papaver somniferum TaxID=3469 RepID=UPI000E6F8970|nr:zinc finger CCCH domain-containing protein 18-like isoform X1 [Papaver somniferum]